MISSARAAEIARQALAGIEKRRSEQREFEINRLASKRRWFGLRGPVSPSEARQRVTSGSPGGTKMSWNWEFVGRYPETLARRIIRIHAALPEAVKTVTLSLEDLHCLLAWIEIQPGMQTVAAASEEGGNVNVAG